jgi:uncharacterized surface protein with fasciclin (FAS1) repeats
MKAKYIIGILAILFSVLSCKKEEKVVNPQLETYLNSNADLSLFNALLQKANIENFKTGTGPFTWLAPSNQGFTEAGINADSINKMSSGTANYLIMYHILNRSLTTYDMISNFSVPRTTQGGQNMFTGRRGNDYFANGRKISATDKMVANGVVHILSRFNTPPPLRGTLQALLNASTEHTLFVAALTKANLWAQFNTASIFTVMAPTNDAMIAEGYTSTTVINALSGTSLTTLTNNLRYHYFLGRRIFSNDLYDGTSPITGVASKFLTISGNGTKVKGNANAAAFNISNNDRLATNGVIHTIDGFLKY